MSNRDMKNYVYGNQSSSTIPNRNYEGKRYLDIKYWFIFWLILIIVGIATYLVTKEAYVSILFITGTFSAVSMVVSWIATQFMIGLWGEQTIVNSRLGWFSMKWAWARLFIVNYPKWILYNGLIFTFTGLVVSFGLYQSF